MSDPKQNHDETKAQWKVKSLLMTVLGVDGDMVILTGA